MITHNLKLNTQERPDCCYTSSFNGRFSCEQTARFFSRGITRAILKKDENIRMQNELPLTLSVKEAAELLGVSPVTIYRLLALKKLKPIEWIRHKRIPTKQILKMGNGDDEK